MISKKHMRLCVTLLVLNVALIWGNSLLPGEISASLSNWVKNLLSRVFPLGGTGGGGLVRKLAHFTEFACLGFLSGYLSGMFLRNRFLSVLGGFAVACVDETIQRFVPGRCASFRDVGIDLCGIIFGMLLLYAGLFIQKHLKNLEETT